MGAGEWRELDRFPPPSQPMRVYLGPGGALTATLRRPMRRPTGTATTRPTPPFVGRFLGDGMG